MARNSKIMSFSLMVTVLLLIMMTGCDFLHHSKPDAEIAIDLNQKGSPFPKDLYGIAMDNLKGGGDVQDGSETGSLKTALELAAKLIALENKVDSSATLNMNDLYALPGLKDEKQGQAIHSPAWYALKMFADNRPDKRMPVKVFVNDGVSADKGVSATAGIHVKSGIVIIKLVNPDQVPRRCSIVLNYKHQVKYKGEVIVLTSESSMDGNSVKEPEKVVPMTKDVNGLRNTFNYACPAHAVVIIHLRYKKGINGFVNCC